MLSRRTFLQSASAVAAVSSIGSSLRSAFCKETTRPAASIGTPKPDEDVFSFVSRTAGRFDSGLYFQVLGAANEFKEGDESAGVAAVDEASRDNARRMLAQTKLGGIDAHPLIEDKLSAFNRQAVDSRLADETAEWTLGGLKTFLLTSDEAAIKSVMNGLSSEVIGCVIKLMSNSELITVGQKIFNPLPGSSIGAKGYLGARVQPNSPTDNVDDIRWQVFDAWSYGVGDVLLGTNPVSSDPKSVAAVERTLQDLLVTFGINDLMPHCVLSHIDIQAEVEERFPGTTALWFQSIAGTDDANHTFDISIEKMRRYASQRTGKFGLYFETGQGADFTNGHSHGFDMVLHESRKYGMARALTQDVAKTQKQTGREVAPWVHLNDVAGFIGPEVFRTKEQLVRCCLEDIVMGKLHGLCLGLDVCSTLHMDVSLDDLDWCLDQIMPANPAYLMALPTKIDPMLGYLTTGYQDHVRLREKFGYKVNDAMWKFFQSLDVVDTQGQPGSNFGRPLQVFLEYQRRQGDTRNETAILADGQRQLGEVRGRGVFIADGHGSSPSELRPQLKTEIDQIYNDAKESIWTELSPEFISRVPNGVHIATKSTDRLDYILHPDTGEHLTVDSVVALDQLRRRHAAKFDVQIVISDGLNALSIMDDGHIAPFLSRLRAELRRVGMRPAPENLVVTSGRVRAGYRTGEQLFAAIPGTRAILHIIGERPGTGHHTFSTYITATDGDTWGANGKVDHNITKVVSGIAVTALKPEAGADAVVRLLRQIVG
ncbi:MAG: ethanolamine ammonia-lyase subunit EutB [Rhodopirellula sp.]|nr:ethanolamine ammonia-lyase subunit EutB [Rhodopirellula sp.]